MLISSLSTSIISGWTRNSPYTVPGAGDIGLLYASDNYCIIPPSTHPSGQQYTVAVDRPIARVEVAELEALTETLGAIAEELTDATRAAIERLVEVLPESDRPERWSDPTERAAQVDDLVSLLDRPTAWHAWLAGWLQAVGGVTDPRVDEETATLVLREARRDEFDADRVLETLDRL